MEKKMDEAESNNRHVVDIDKWAGSLTKELQDVRPTESQPGRIWRIPRTLCGADVKAYEPLILSIGPYHHGKPNVQEMEKRKLSTLRSILKKKPEFTLKKYLMELKDVESEARRFYFDVGMESEQFVRMLLLDGLFIITMFVIIHDSPVNPMSEGIGTGVVDGDDDTQERERSNRTNDDSESPIWLWGLSEHDIFLLENQLPFFVLQKIYTLVYGPSDSDPQLLDIIKHGIVLFLHNYMKADSDSDSDSEMVISQTKQVYHLLHLCHMLFRPTSSSEQLAAGHLCCIPPPASDQHSLASHQFRLKSAVELYEAGVSFRTKPGSSKHNLLDITFGRYGKMVIPCLHVDDNTESLFRNLIALEMMMNNIMGPSEQYISAYVMLMVHLIQGPRDVELLARRGIIQHQLGSNVEMANFMNRLGVGVIFSFEDEYPLKPVFQKMKRYSDCKVNWWWAWLRNNYFSNPWLFISLLAATLLLLFSALQTFYTVYPYYRPRS